MKRNVLFLLLVSFLFAFSCDDDKKQENEKDCSNVPCTKELRTITVNLKDASENPIALDSIKVVREEDGKDITIKSNDFEWGLQQKAGSYPLVSDSMQEELKHKKVEVRFKGFLAGKTVADAKFVVGADCCHVWLLEGDNTLIIE